MSICLNFKISTDSGIDFSTKQEKHEIVEDPSIASLVSNCIFLHEPQSVQHSWFGSTINH
jgi:hypothetical protein